MNIVERNSRFKLIKKILFGIGLILILFIGVALEVNIRKNYEVMSIDKHEVEELQKLAPSSSSNSNDDIFSERITVGDLQGVDKFYCPESMNFSTPWRISSKPKSNGERVPPEEIMFCREYYKSFIFSAGRDFRVSGGQQYAEYVKDEDEILEVPQSVAYYNYYFPIQNDYYSNDESDIDSRYSEKDAIDRSRQLVIWTADSWKDKANTNSLPQYENKINKTGSIYSIIENNRIGTYSSNSTENYGRNSDAETRSIQYANFRYFALKDNQWTGTGSGFSNQAENAKFNVKLGIRLVDAEKVSRSEFEPNKELNGNIINNTLSTSNKEELTNGYLNNQKDYENQGLVDISSNEIKSQNTRCLVDNVNNEYLFGPYMLSFDNMNNKILNSSMTAGTLTYKEITKQNPGQYEKNSSTNRPSGMIDANNTFCYGSFKSTIIRQGEDENSSTLTSSAIHTGLNKFDVNYNDYKNTRFEIIYTDNGQKEERNFPQFGRSFYIKYKSSDEEIPVRNIKIEARVKYTTYIHMRAQKYKSIAVYANPGKTTVPEVTDGQEGRSLINERTYSWGEGVYERQQIDKAGVVVGDPKFIAYKAGSSTQQTLAGERVYYDTITGDKKVNTFENGKYDVTSGLLGGIITHTELRYKQELQNQNLYSDQDLSKIAVNMGLYVGFAYITDGQSQAQSYTGRIYLYDPDIKKVSSANVENNSATIETEETVTKDFTMLDRLDYDHSDPQDSYIYVRRAWGDQQDEEINTKIKVSADFWDNLDKRKKLFKQDEHGNWNGKMIGDLDEGDLKNALDAWAKKHPYSTGDTSSSTSYVIKKLSTSTWIHHYKIKPELETGEFTLSSNLWYYSGSDLVAGFDQLNSVETCTREIEVLSPISDVDPKYLIKTEATYLKNKDDSVKEEVLKNDGKIKTSFMVVLYKSPSPILVVAREHAIQDTITFADLNQNKQPFNGDVSENIPGISLGITWGTEEIYTPYKQDDYSMYLGGTVWRENGEIKTESTDNEYKLKTEGNLGQDMPYPGVQVSLYDIDLKRVVGLTTTDKNGTYGFRNLNPVHKYKVYYTYNGMYYEDIDTSVREQELLAGGYTNAHDNGTRSENANRFSYISSSNANYKNDQSGNMSIDNLGITDSNVIGTNMLNPGGSKITDISKFGYILKNGVDGPELIPQNYDSKFTYINGEKKAYGYYTKIENANGDYISFDKSTLQGIIADGEYQDGDNTPSMDNPEGTTNYGALRFCDVWNIFQGLAYNNNEIYNETKEQMDGIARDKQNHLVDERFTKIYNGYLDISRANLVGTNGNVISGNGFVGDGSNPTLCMVDDAFFRKYDRFIDKLRSLGISENEANNLLSYILDTMVTAETDHDYALYQRFALLDIDLSYKGCPENLKYNMSDQQIQDYINNNKQYYDTITGGGYQTSVVNTPANDYFYLYTRFCDQSRNVDFGVVRRKTSDLALQKDVYNVTTIINGEEETYRYNQKKLDRVKEGDLDEWDITVRASDVLYNGHNVYNRPIRRSEYLYDGSDANTADAKNLQVLVTYRIAVKNSGMVPMRLEEIVDYYDSDRYIFDCENVSGDGNAIADSEGYFTPRSYNKYDENGNQLSDKSKTYLDFRDVDGNQSGRIDTIKISNISKNGGTQGNKGQINKPQYNYNSLYITGFDKTLEPGEMYLVYVTFKVKNDPNTGRIIMDEADIPQAPGFYNLGGKNIAEINAYSTENTELSDRGLVDFDSNPGSLNSGKDLDDEGDLIYVTGEDGKYDPLRSRGEDDIDKAPNVMLKIQDDDRAIKGYVFEDERNIAVESAYIGDGKYTDNENKINGVTVQLVELVKEVDDKGMFTGRYTGEHIWNTMKYDNGFNVGEYKDRYASGRPESRIILTSDINKLKAEPDNSLGDGEYSFKSVPPGDFIIRFIYGDTTETVLVNNEENKVNKLLAKEGDELTDTQVLECCYLNDYQNKDDQKYQWILGTKGLNEKSYNGQDYKSTTYQAGQVQDGSYNGILSYLQTGKNLNTVNLDNIDSLNANQNYTKYSVDNNALNVTLNDGTDKSTMYWYNIDDGNNENNDIESSNSDAKDIYVFRELCNAYSKGAKSDGTNDDTLENYRAEVLASFEKVGTYQKNTDVTDKLRQIKMLQELINNTKMVAQTGVINTRVEYNNAYKEVQYDKNQRDGGYKEQYAYVIDKVNLGLVERPKAGLKLTKSVTNLKITLANGQIMFDSNKAVKNLIYTEHNGHNVSYSHGGLRLANASINENNTRFTPELINAYMDDELMDGATIEVLYKIRVDNIGEVDYIDNRFYYMGEPIDSTENNVSKTSAPIVVDYVSNTIKYDRQRQNDNSKWDIRTPSDLMPSIGDNDKKFASNKDFVNRQYSEEITTYNMLLTTQKLDGELMPQTYYVVKEGNNAKNNINTFKETELILSTLLSNSDSENAVYNNLTEIIQVKNTQGRRMQYSIVGNQEMADQSLGNNPNIFAFSNVDLVSPSEIDADSAQKIMVLPPTGENKDYKIIIITALGALTLLMSGVILTIYAFKKTRF